MSLGLISQMCQRRAACPPFRRRRGPPAVASLWLTRKGEAVQLAGFAVGPRSAWNFSSPFETLGHVLMTVEQPEEDVRTWFYAPVANLGLVRTDCPQIFRTSAVLVVN